MHKQTVSLAVILQAKFYTATFLCLELEASDPKRKGSSVDARTRVLGFAKCIISLSLNTSAAW